MENSSTSTVEEQRKIVLKMTSGKELTLNNVLHVPEIRKNLISEPLLIKNGFKLVFESDNVVLSKSGMYVGRDYMSDGLFQLNVNTVVPNLAINNKNTSSVYIAKSFFFYGMID